MKLATHVAVLSLVCGLGLWHAENADARGRLFSGLFNRHHSCCSPCQPVCCKPVCCKPVCCKPVPCCDPCGGATTVPSDGVIVEEHAVPTEATEPSPADAPPAPEPPVPDPPAAEEGAAEEAAEAGEEGADA